MTLNEKRLYLSAKVLRRMSIFIFLALLTNIVWSQTSGSDSRSKSIESPKAIVTADSFSVSQNADTVTTVIAADSFSTRISPSKVKKIIEADALATQANMAKATTGLKADTIPNLPITDTSRMFFNKKSLSLGLNFAFVNGIGIDVSYRFASKWSVRTAANLAGFAYNNFKYTLKPKAGDSTAASTTPQTFAFNFLAKMSSANLGIEYAMGRKGKFRIMTGLAYYPSNYISISGRLATVYHFHEVDLNSEDLGSGTITIGFKNQIAPYFGIGIGRLYPLRRLNISVDAGAIYKGDYKIGILVNEGALIQKSNEDNAAILEKNLNAHQAYKFWPNFNLRIGYRLF